MIRLTLLALVLAAMTAPASADWRLDQTRSSLSFTYTEAGRAQAGEFTRMAAEGALDFNRLDEVRMVLTVDVASIDLGDALKSLFSLSEDWFDSDHFAEAVFTLAELRPLGDEMFSATGDLRIKGAVQQITADITLVPLGERIRVNGKLPLNRRHFGVGVGFTDRLMKLSDVIEVSFTLEAVRITGAESK